MNADARPVDAPDEATPQPQRVPVVQSIWNGTAVACTLCWMFKRHQLRVLRSVDGAMSHLRGHHHLTLDQPMVNSAVGPVPATRVDQLTSVYVEIATDAKGAA